jgi:imidazolonepropionase-like amidohydrolase
VRNAINEGLIPGPRLRISGNAIDILGGHEDALNFNPAQHVLSNADYANTAAEMVAVMRAQHKEGSDFAKVYETGPDRMADGVLHTPYQYTEAQLAAAVEEARRLGAVVAVHAMGEPGTLYAAQAGVASIDHATQLSDETMRLMREKQIPAVPTLTIFEYFAQRAESPAIAAREGALLNYKISEFKKQVAAGIPFAVGSDVGPFPHGTQAKELELMVRYGMKPLAVLQADLINGAKLLGWEGQIGQLKAGYFADVIAVPGNPLDAITAVQHVSFVMKGGVVVRP